MKKKLGISGVLLCAMLLAGSCGGSPAANKDGDTTDSSSEAEPAAQPSPSSTYGFADYDFYEVDRGACTELQSVGSKTAIALDVHKPKSEVGEFFYPNCFTNVRSDELTVTMTNSGMTTHNFIVEGDDVELVVHPGDKGKIDIELGPGGEIGFQCTIHERFMFGAFFRKDVA